MITKQEVRTFRIDKKCPKCDIGNMIATGTRYTTNVTQVQHRCNNCSHECSYINQSYPLYSHENIGEITLLIDDTEEVQ
jgi:phage FluMu protein Com